MQHTVTYNTSPTSQIDGAFELSQIERSGDRCRIALGEHVHGLKELKFLIVVGVEPGTFVEAAVTVTQGWHSTGACL